MSWCVLHGLVLAWSAVWPQQTEPQTPTVETTPTAFLYLDADRIELLRKQAAASAPVQRLLAFASLQDQERARTLPPFREGTLPQQPGSWRIHGDRLAAMAAASQLAPASADRDRFRDWCLASMTRLRDYRSWRPRGAEDGLDLPHLVSGYAIAFDFLRPSLNPTQIDRLADRLRREGKRIHFATRQNAPEWWVSTTGSAAHQVYILALAQAGFALLPIESELSRAWIDEVAADCERGVALRRARGEGSDPEGAWHAVQADTALFATLDLLRSHQVLDLLDPDWLTARARFHLLATVPPRAVQSSDVGMSVTPQAALLFLARELADPYCARLAESWDRSLSGDLPWGLPVGVAPFFECLWSPPGELPSATPPPPQDARFPDWGTALFRRDRTPRSTLLVFRCGLPGGQALWQQLHQSGIPVGARPLQFLHPDAGSFTYAPAGVPMLGAVGRQMPKRTALACTLTFRPAFPLETSPVQQGWIRTWNADYLNDLGRFDEVGQAGEWGRRFAPEPERQTRNIGPIESGMVGSLWFASGEFSGAYPTRIAARGGAAQDLGLKSVRRTLILFPDDSLLVVDRVDCLRRLGVQAWFRSRSDGAGKPHWRAAPPHAVLDNGAGQRLVLEVLYPSGTRLEPVQEITDLDRVQGSNRRGIRDWNRVEEASAGLRVSLAEQEGVQHYLYLLRPQGASTELRGIDVQPDQVSLDLQALKHGYSLKLFTAEIGPQQLAPPRLTLKK